MAKFILKRAAIFTLFFFVGLCLSSSLAMGNENKPVTADEKSQGESTGIEKTESSPGTAEVEGPDSEGAVVKAKKKFPWLLVGAGVVVAGILVYFLLIKKKEQTLTVSLGAGTTGTPAVTAKFKKGTVVNYTYTPQTGYDSLQVKLDGVEVLANGIITMNGNHSLSVSAAKIEATYKNGVLTVNGVRYELAPIPAGEFQMGSNSAEAFSCEKPFHTVRISKGFWMGKTEVTQGLWQAVMGSNPSDFKYGDTYPVDSVSWDDCQSFITKLNQMLGSNYFRLPTEAEWEYACRAGTTGDRYGNIDAIAWYKGNSNSSTHPVGQKQANAWGLFDTLGNVWEWCQDWFGPYSAGYQVDPTGPASGSDLVIRGGCWCFEARIVRSAYRNGYFSFFNDWDLSLRLTASSAGN